MKTIDAAFYAGIAAITIVFVWWDWTVSYPAPVLLVAIGLGAAMIYHRDRKVEAAEARAESFRQKALQSVRERSILTVALASHGKTTVELEPILDKVLADAEKEVGT